MSEDKKKIFVGDRELEDSLVELLVKLSVEYVSDGDGGDFEYHLHGDNAASKSISFSPVESLKTFLESKGRAIVNPGYANNDISKVLINRFFEGIGSLDPSSTIADFLDETYTLKITNPMNVGYYQDLIVENAVLKQFNFVAIRNYLNSVLTFLSYLKHSELGEVPFDVDYGFSDGTFYIQVSSRVQNLFLDNLIESIQDSDPNNPYYSALKMAFENVHFMDVFTLEKGSKLCFCAVWSKDIVQEEEFYPSLLVHELYTVAEVEEDHSLLSKINIVKKNLNDERVGYPGAGAVNFVDEQGHAKNNNAVLIKKIVHFLDNARFDNGEDLVTFTNEHYQKYISSYHDQDSLERLEQDDITLIIECLNDGKKAASLDEEVQVIKDNLEDDDYAERITGSLDDLAEEVQKISGSSEEGDDSQTITGSSEEDDYTQTISGGNESKSDVTKVKGGTVDNDDGGKFVVKGGSSGEKKKDVWKVKGMKAAGKIKEEVQRLKASGASVEEINMKVKSLVKDEFGEDEEGANMFFDNLSDMASDKAVAEQDIKKSSIFDNVQVDLDIELPDDENRVDSRKISMLENSVKMRDQQLKKMKKLMDRMKKEVDRERKATADIQDVGGTGVDGETMRGYIAQATELKSTVVNLEKAVTSANNILEQERKNKDTMARNFEREKDILLKKLEKYEGTPDDGPTESIAQIKKNNEALTRQVDELKKRISTVLDNTKKSQDEMVSASEYNRVKNELAENMTKLSDAYTERKKATDMSKSLAFKLRAAEQRIKSYSGKLEKAQNASKGAGDGMVDPKSAHRVKHLEKTNERLQALSKKVSDELAEKKAELHKTKMESKALESKVKELEKKLEKKAA